VTTLFDIQETAPNFEQLRLAGLGFLRAWAIAAQALGLDRAGRLALLEHVLGRPFTSSREIRADEVPAAWRALGQVRRRTLRVLRSPDGKRLVVERPAVGFDPDSRGVGGVGRFG
jgi:hypothetical protein